VGTISNATLDLCCAACDNTTGCTTFVWASDDGMCYLMRGVRSLSVNATNRVVGSRLLSNGTFPTVGEGCLPRGAVSARFQLVAGAATSPVNWTGQWLSGESPTGNLGGVQSKLDCYSTPAECYEQYVNSEYTGLLSTDGWAVLDETMTARLAGTQSGTVFGPWWVPTATDPPTAVTRDVCDSLLLLHGRDYKAVARDWQEVSGPLQLLDRTMYDVWWSRHDPWNSTQLKELLEGYS